MSRSMRRAGLAVAVVLAAAAATLAPSATARAGGNGNSLAGAYVGALPGLAGLGAGWHITIGKNGKLTGAYSNLVGGTLGGHIDNKGHMECAGTLTAGQIDGPPSTPFSFTATVTQESDGDIVGTAASGEPLLWTRQ